MGLKVNQLTRQLISLQHIGLDSMCFLYQFSNHLLYGPLTQIIFDLAQERKIHCYTSTISLIETFILPEKQRDVFMINRYEKFFQHLPNLQVTAVDWNTGRLVSKLKAKYSGIKTPDAIQIASALLQGCSLFVTNDKQLRQVSEIKVTLLSDYV